VSDFHQVTAKKGACQTAPSIIYIENIVEALILRRHRNSKKCEMWR